MEVLGGQKSGDVYLRPCRIENPPAFAGGLNVYLTEDHKPGNDTSREDKRRFHYGAYGSIPASRLSPIHTPYITAIRSSSQFSFFHCKTP